MKQYSFINEGAISKFFKDTAMCQRAQQLREKIADECIFQIKKLKDFYKQGRINRKQYKYLLAKKQDKLSRLQLRLDKLDLL